MRRLPFLTRTDRRALLWLEWIVILIMLGCYVYTWIVPDDPSTTTQNHPQQRQQHARTHKGKTYTYATQEEPVETFPFDPNTADSTQFLRLGLAPWQVRAIYRYRAKHGRYHTPEDFARLPGMTNELWERLSPVIRIDKRFQYVDAQALSASHRPSTPEPATSEGTSTSTVQRDTTLYPEKYREMVQVDLNHADTIQLKKIPGIASYRARQIVQYRELLGGFVSTEQVMESCPLPDEVLEWFCLTDTRTRKININRASVQTMRKHPYITFYQARAIYEHRYSKGAFRSLYELLSLKEFTQQDLERLQFYVEL